MSSLLHPVLDCTSTMMFRSIYTFTFLPLEPSRCCPELPVDASLTLNPFALPPMSPTVSYIDNPSALLISQWFIKVTPLQLLHSLLSLPVFFPCVSWWNSVEFYCFSFGQQSCSRQLNTCLVQQITNVLIICTISQSWISIGKKIRVKTGKLKVFSLSGTMDYFVLQRFCFLIRFPQSLTCPLKSL